MRSFLMLFVIGFLVTGCSNMPLQELNPATYYVNDVCVTWHKSRREEVKFCGAGTLPYAESYDLTIQNDGKLNFFAMTTCHRENTTENPDKGIFRKDGKIKVTYTPTVEKGRACALYIAAYNRQGKHGWAAVFFENPRFQLKAKIECNGETYASNGVGVCQTRRKLITRIQFEDVVVPLKPVNGPAERSSDCPVLDTKDNKLFEFLMPTRECVYGFVDKATRKVNQFNTIGYEQLIIRE